MPLLMQWCAECHRRVEVEDEFSASEMTARGEAEYWVVALECGHQVSGEPHLVGPAPGAPYAGTKGYATYRSFNRRHLHPSGEVNL